MKRRAPTLVDIATIVGVTPMVVSDVLKGRDDRIRASPQTQKKIRETAEQLHYRPNGSARAMRQNHCFNIGYLTIRDPSDYVVEAIESGICEVANQRGYRVTLIKHLHGWNPTEEEVPSIYREAHLDALIVDTFRFVLPPVADRLLATGRMPIIYFNQKKAYNSVQVDDVLGGRIVTSHLVEQGYRRISFLYFEGNHYHSSVVDRVSGYRAVMEANGLDPEEVSIPDGDTFSRIAEWICSSHPEAVICHNDNQTFFVQRALYKLGLRAPQDLAFAGFNGETLCHHSPIPLTSVRIPFFEMARTAMELAIQLGEDPECRPIPAVTYEPGLIIAASTLRALDVRI